MRPSLLALLIALTATTTAATAQAAPPDAKALAAQAKQAAAESRFCDAMHLYQLAYGATGEAKYLNNAAEVAFAATDRVTALQLYREVLAKFPAFEKRKKVEERVGQLGRALAEEGVGTACPARQPACGDGLVEGDEQCDDGNGADGDGCDSVCRPTGCGNGVVTAGEQCDDGNRADGDDCTAACSVPQCEVVVNPGETCASARQRWAAAQAEAERKDAEDRARRAAEAERARQEAAARDEQERQRQQQLALQRAAEEEERAKERRAAWDEFHGKRESVQLQHGLASAVLVVSGLSAGASVIAALGGALTNFEIQSGGLESAREIEDTAERGQFFNAVFYATAVGAGVGTLGSIVWYVLTPEPKEPSS